MQDDLERQLHLERARLEAVLRQMPSGVLIVEAPSGKVVLANEQLAQISGRTTRYGETLEGYRDWPTYHSDGRLYQVEEWPLYRSMFHGETVIDEEMGFVKSDGMRAVMRASSAPIRDPDGRIVAAIVTIQDITERKLAEEALRASEERFRLLFERNLAGVCRSTEAGWLLDCNDSFAHILGYADRAEVLAQKAHDLYFSPADREAFLAALRKEESVTGYETRYRRRDGSPVWVLENATLQTVDGDAFIDATLVNITLRKQAEEAARVSAARYRSLVENLSQGIALKDQELRYAVVNRPFCEALGHEETEIIGKTDFDLYPRALAEKYDADDRVILSGGPRIETEQELRVDGKPRTVRVVKTPVRDAGGRVVGVLGIFWDVTDQQALEAQLRQAQKMEAVGLLAGGVAHDFNNLLSVIIGNIALSLGSMSEDHPNRELLLAAERAGVQAAELTNSLLGFSRQTILRPVPTDLQTCVEDTVRILRRTIDPRIEVVVRASPNLWQIEADPVQMNQVLLNLCINARDAMPRGGRLTLESENLLVDPDYAGRHVEARPGEFVRLRISDTGQGIPPEIRPRIFEPFFTTKETGKGTGLGLAMVFGIVKQHQGWIECYSEIGRGTRFDIYLPRHGTWAAPGALPQSTQEAPRGGTETILLADDEPMIRKLGRTVLERYGYRVLLAEDGVEAISVYQREPGVNLVILDLTMPRMSGQDALLQLVQIDPAVRVLLSSGYSADHAAANQHDRVLGFLSKPFRPEKLAQAVRAALDASSSRSN